MEAILSQLGSNSMCCARTAALQGVKEKLERIEKQPSCVQEALKQRKNAPRSDKRANIVPT